MRKDIGTICLEADRCRSPTVCLKKGLRVVGYNTLVGLALKRLSKNVSLLHPSAQRDGGQGSRKTIPFSKSYSLS
jgi:hypothetical protein